MYSKRRKGELEYIQKNTAGEYVYTGARYVYAGDLPRKRALLLLWLAAGLSAACALGSGLLPAPGMTGCWYVPLPCVLCLVAAVSQLWGLGQLTLSGDPIREFVYETACKKLPLRAMLTAVLAGVSVLGELCYLLLHGPGDRLFPALGYLLLMVLSCVFSGLSRGLLPRLHWDKES